MYLTMKEKEKSIKSCSGCKCLCYWNSGEPFCEKEFEKICFKTNFILWEAREDDDKELAYSR